MSVAQEVPERHFDARPCVGRLQQIHTVVFDLRRDAADVVGAFDGFTEYGGANRAADAVRHWADKGGDGGQRGRLAFAPADVAAGSDADQQRVLAAVRFRRDLRHGQVKQIDGFDLHGERS